MCLQISIFIETPSLEGFPTMAKEDPSPHEMRLCPAGYQPSIFWSIIIIVIIIIIIIIITTTTTTTTVLISLIVLYQ